MTGTNFMILRIKEIKFSIFYQTIFDENKISIILSSVIHMRYLIGIYDGLGIHEIHSEPTLFCDKRYL